MKKSKIVLSLISVLLSGVLMFTVFSSSVFNENISRADVKIGGSGIRISDLTDYLYRRLFYDDQYIAPENESNSNELETVYLGGFPVGLKLYADGVVVVGTEAVDTDNGFINAAEKAGIRTGDIIKKINGEEVKTNKRVSEIIEQSAGQAIQITVSRDGNLMNFTFKSEYSVSESKYKAGIWIRDSSAGIGTVTFCTSDGRFASLGHAVCDIDTGEVVPIDKGQCTEVNLTGYYRGKAGEAGELCGVLESDVTGTVAHNGDIGVYGEFDSLPDTQMYEVAPKDEVYEGGAMIYTTLENGIIEAYTIQILKVDNSQGENKNLLIKVTDDDLLERTGGIIQGMSGSPIIQNGRIVGAVTHVLVDTPEKGYGIFAQTMLDELNNTVK